MRGSGIYVYAGRAEQQLIVFMSFLSQNCFLIVSVVAPGILFRELNQEFSVRMLNGISTL